MALLLRAGSRLCALALSDVVEIMRPLAVEAVGGAPAGVLGLAVIRGTPVPVVDLGFLLGSPSRAARFVTVRAGSRRVALAVDAVLGIRPFSPADLSAMPPLLADAPAEIIQAIGVLDEAFFLVLQAGRLAPEEPS